MSVVLSIEQAAVEREKVEMRQKQKMKNAGRERIITNVGLCLDYSLSGDSPFPEILTEKAPFRVIVFKTFLFIIYLIILL